MPPGHGGRKGNLLWLLFGAAIPFLGGLGLACFGDGGSNRSTGIALMVGTIVPVLIFLYIAWGHLRGGSLRWPTRKPYPLTEFSNEPVFISFENTPLSYAV